MKALRILIADDHDLKWRQGCQGDAAITPGMGSRMGKGKTDGRLLRRLKSLSRISAILDIGMPDLNGVDAARRIRKESPDAKIVDSIGPLLGSIEFGGSPLNRRERLHREIGFRPKDHHPNRNPRKSQTFPDASRD